jgi:hypothetical protein
MIHGGRNRKLTNLASKKRFSICMDRGILSLIGVFQRKMDVSRSQAIETLAEVGLANFRSELERNDTNGK